MVFPLRPYHAGVAGYDQRRRPVDSDVLLYLPTVLPFVTTEFRDNCYPLFSRTSKREESGGSGSAARRFISFTITVRVALGSVQRGMGQFDAREMTEMVRALDRRGDRPRERLVRSGGHQEPSQITVR